MLQKCYTLLTGLILFSMFMMVPGLSAQSTYVGPEKCLQCHSNPSLGDMTGWRTSMHANGYSDVTDDSKTMQDLFGVVNDYDSNGVDDFHDGLNFNDISSAFDPFKPNAPILAYSANDGYTITIGEVTSRVYLTYGGSGLYKQRYAMRIPDSTGAESADMYISPIQYNEKTHEYVLYHPDDYWVHDNGTPSNVPVFTSASALSDIATNSRSFTKGCSGCHTTGMVINPKDANGEWTMSGGAIDPTTITSYTNNNIFDLDGDGVKEQLNNGCETCHGPGSEHAMTTDKTKIINPATDMTTLEAANMCGMCHSRGKSLPNNTFSFPYDDDNFTSWSLGDLVASLYSDGGGDWPDGSSKKHHQQFFDFNVSGKGDLLMPWRDVTCYDCHDVHNSEKHHMRTARVSEDSTGAEITIATENDNNTLCLACHATHGDFTDIPIEWVADYTTNVDAIAAVVSKHTNHKYDPTGTGASRCSKCHNPKIIKSAVAYDIHAHTFEALSPKKTLDMAMPNACAVSCHIKESMPNFGVDVASDNLTDWSEQTDVDLAEELLYWYDNQWFRQLGGEGKTVEAPEVTSAFTMDGDTTDWAGIDWTKDIPLANGRMVSMKAAVTLTDIYFLAKWDDATLSMTRGGSWSFDGSAWAKSSGQNEDRLGMLWNISIPEEDWDARGCMNKCHTDIANTNAGNDHTTNADDAYLPTGQKADMWHMKAARSLGTVSANQAGVLTIDPASHEVTAGEVSLVGYVDDKYVGDFTDSGDGGRHGDAGGSTYSHNRNADKNAPKYIETNPADYIDAMILRQAEIDNGEALEVATMAAGDLTNAWAVYAGFSAVVPERILRVPLDSRADVTQAAIWKDGVWYTEIKRALNTGNDDDAQFTVGTFKFGVALIDNGGGSSHWTSGNVLNTLSIPSITGVDSRDLVTIPEEYSLSQNYPNPFNPSTNIEFNVAKQGQVVLKVYNVIGKEVATILDKVMPAGSQRIIFNGSNLASGLYFYRLEVNGFAATKKLILIK